MTENDAKKLFIRFFNTIYALCNNTKCEDCPIHNPYPNAGRECMFDEIPFYWDNDEIEQLVERLMLGGF